MFDPFSGMADHDNAFGGISKKPEYLIVRANGLKKKQQKIKVSRDSETIEDFINRDILLKDDEEINQKS